MDISFLARRADIQNPSVVKKAQQLSQEVEITCHGGLGEVLDINQLKHQYSSSFFHLMF